MMNAKVKIKAIKSSAIRIKILGACSGNGIKVTRLLEVDEGYLMHCVSVEDLDNLFDNKVQATLTSIGVKCILPAELRAKRSVIVRRLDISIYERSEAELLAEIVSKNSWAEVVEIYKFPNSKTMKIQFISSAVAQRCLSNGLSLFYLHISGSDMTADQVVPILTCYKCYSLEDHITSKCPKQESFMVCSVCASNEHTWRDCKTSIKRCVNCYGNHNSLSMQCPRRKAIIKSKRTDHKVSYRDVVSNAQLMHSGDIIQDNKRVVKSISCLFLALFKSSDGSTDFSDTVNELFNMNGLPALNLSGLNIDATSVLQNIYGTKDNESSINVNAVIPPPVTEAPPVDAAVPPLVAAVPPPVVTELPPVATKPPPASVSGSAAPSSGPLNEADASCESRKLKFFKSKGVVVKTVSDLLKAYDNGRVMITSSDGGAIDYSVAIKVIESFRNELPSITEVKASDFNILCASPARYFKSRSINK